MNIALPRGCVVLLLPLLLVVATASAQVRLPSDDELRSFQPNLGGAATAENPVEVAAQFALANDAAPKADAARRGWLFVTARIEPGWHIYSVTQPSGGPVPSKITVADSPQYRLLDSFTSRTRPLVKRDAKSYGDLPIEEHYGEVTWHAPVELAAGVDAAQVRIEGKLQAQPCTKTSCLAPQQLAFSATLGEAPYDPAAIQAERGGAAPSNRSTVYKNPNSHATIRGWLEPQVATPGEKVRVTLRAEPDDQWYVYTLADRAPPIGSRPTLIALKETPGWPATPPQANQQPVEPPAGADGQPPLAHYEGPVSWTLEIEVPRDARPGKYPLAGLIGYQTCWKEGCDLPLAAEFQGVLQVGDQGRAGQVPLEFQDAKYAEAARLAAGGGVSRASASTPPAALPAVSEQGGPDASFLGMLAIGYLGGLILNLMPCVLPVIGLKVLSFVEQSGHSRGRAVALNLWYSLGLLSVFWVLATLAAWVGLGWGQQFNSPAFTITLACVVFVFALSFLGVWEIPIPGFIGTSKAQDLAEKEGAAGAVAKGVLTTILATPCTGPYLFPALTWAVAQPAYVIYAVFTAVGLGLATPYLVIGAFPRLVAFLPRPGAWMETFKQLMGFVLLGTVVWLLTAIPWTHVIPALAMMIGLWMACWIIGRTPLTADLGPKVRAWGWAVAVGGAAGIAAFVWLEDVMEHRFQQMLDAEFVKREELVSAVSTAGERNWVNFLQDREKKLASAPPNELPWQAFSRRRLELLQQNGYTVLLDFTAHW